MARGRKTKARKATPRNDSYLERVNSEIQTNQSKLSMVLGGLIVLVVGILIFNYFNKDNGSLGPAQQNQQQQDQQADVTVENLPGKYIVKEGDTLFLIAEKYYKDGEKFTEIAKANNLTDVNALTTGQVLEIPKLADAPTTVESSSSVSPTPAAQVDPGTGTGGGDTTVWGPKITGDSYTVIEGDWLSTISARAYGDPMAYQKIAQANNIPNPDLIYPGQILKLPR